MTSPSEYQFAALFTYSPRGQSDISKKSRRLRDAVKNASPEFLKAAATELAERERNGSFGGFFDGNCVLVPAPRSSPLVKGALWPGKRICDALVHAGIGDEVRPLLARTTAVPKAAFAPPGQRPTADRHLETLDVEPQLGMHDRIIVVDDFITRGDMMWACAARLADAFPGSQVAGFALVRTLGLVPEVEKLVDPCVGTISRDQRGNVHRHP